jgi:hypothetical protein
MAMNIGKDLVAASSTPLVLAILREGESYGYAIKLPELFGFHMSAPITDSSFYVRNFSLFVLPLLAGYFAWKRTVDRGGRVWLALPFVVAVLAVNVFPFDARGQTLLLAAIHLPIALWLAVGYAYIGGRWNDHYRRMDIVRFSGEWFIYYTLIAFGGGVLMAFTMFIFQAIGIDAEELVAAWVMPCGVVGAVVISAWLVEAKKSVIENMAPVLTRLFTPLFTVVLLVFLATMVWTGSAINVEREVLIGFDLLLVLVLGLLLYSISARDPQSKPGIFDVLQLVLVVFGAARRRGRSLGHLRPHLGVRFQPQQSRGPGGEPGAAGEPGMVDGALRPFPGRVRLVHQVGALADRLPAGLCGMGLGGGSRLPTSLRLPLGTPAAPLRALRPLAWVSTGRPHPRLKRRI